MGTHVKSGIRERARDLFRVTVALLIIGGVPIGERRLRVEVLLVGFDPIRGDLPLRVL